MKILEKLKRYFICKNSLGRYLYILYVKKFVVKLKNDETGLVCDLNLGETYLFCSMLNDFKADHNIKKVVLISERNYYRNICEMFDERIERYCISRWIFSRSFRPFREINEGTFYFIYDPKKWTYAKLIENGRTHLEQLKSTAGIRADAKIKHHKSKDEYKKSAKELFDSLELQLNKTVLLSPEAKSCESLDEKFLQKLSENLSNMGYDVFLNTANTNQKVSYAKSVFLPLTIAKEFCDLCGYIIAVRSGFCDIVSNTAARLHIIYPDKTFYKVFPIKEKATSNYICEYFLDNDSKENILTKICSSI